MTALYQIQEAFHIFIPWIIENTLFLHISIFFPCVLHGLDFKLNGKSRKILSKIGFHT